MQEREKLPAIALFGGAHFPKQKAAFVVTLDAMYLSDLVLGFWVYDVSGFGRMGSTASLTAPNVDLLRGTA